MIELKPCPFCGGKAELNVDPEAIVDIEGRRWAFTVSCNRCCAASGLTYLPEKAVEAWNRRKNNDEV
jgi:Lar family restriction alleviation protein